MEEKSRNIGNHDLEHFDCFRIVQICQEVKRLKKAKKMEEKSRKIGNHDLEHFDWLRII